jgi:hypothetical protein
MPEKYRDEIEEILKQADEILSEGPDRSYGINRPDYRKWPGTEKMFRRWPTSHISASKVMLAGLAILVLVFFVGAVGGPPVMLFVGFGLGLFIVAYFLYFHQSGSRQYEKRWRGRLIEDETTSVWTRLWQWLKR